MAAAPTLQLDGTLGNLTILQDVSLAGRNADVVSIQNLAGSNTLAGGFIFVPAAELLAGFRRRQLNLGGLIPSSAPTVPSARTLTFMGAGNILVSGVISNANGYAVSLVKSNTGT